MSQCRKWVSQPVPYLFIMQNFAAYFNTLPIIRHYLITTANTLGFCLKPKCCRQPIRIEYYVMRKHARTMVENSFRLSAPLGSLEPVLIQMVFHPTIRLGQLQLLPLNAVLEKIRIWKKNSILRQSGTIFQNVTSSKSSVPLVLTPTKPVSVTYRTTQFFTQSSPATSMSPQQRSYVSWPFGQKRTSNRAWIVAKLDPHGTPYPQVTVCSFCWHQKNVSPST